MGVLAGESEAPVFGEVTPPAWVGHAIAIGSLSIPVSQYINLGRDGQRVYISKMLIITLFPRINAENIVYYSFALS